MAPTCFIEMVFHGLRPSHAGHEKMSYTHTHAEGKSSPGQKKPLKRPEPSGYEPEPSDIWIGPHMFHRNGFSWLATVARRPRKNVLHGKSSPGPKKKHRKVSIPAPRGIRAPDQKKQSDLQYSRTSSEDVYEYYRPNHSKIMYSNTRREDVKQYCKSQRLRDGSPPHTPRVGT